jgi:hypothetical protein
VMNEVPEDRVARSAALEYNVGPEKETNGTFLPGDVQLVVPANGQPGAELTLHPHAFRQAAERSGVPAKYAEELAAGEPWQRQLVVHALNESFHHMPGRNLVRSVGGQARAVLSDKFRRLDSRPIIDTFLGEVDAAGAVPYAGAHTDVKVSIKAIVPRVHALTMSLPGANVSTLQQQQEFLAFGIEIGNSDYGAGGLAIRSFFLRLVCLNGATAEDVMRQVHLGKRLGDDLMLSQKTYALDTETMTSAVKDVVRAQLGPKSIDSLIARVQAATEQEVNWAGLKSRLAGTLTKAELRRADEAFKGPDVINLPPGNTAWRASNAISWLANAEGINVQRKLDLEKLAGGLMTGRVVAVDEAA